MASKRRTNSAKPNGSRKAASSKTAASPRKRSTAAKRSTSSDYLIPAIATGTVAAIAATVAGFLFFRNSDKTFGELTEEWSSRIKDGVQDVTDQARSRAREIRGKSAFDFTDDELSDEFADNPSAEEIIADAVPGDAERKPRATDSFDPDDVSIGAIG